MWVCDCAFKNNTSFLFLSILRYMPTENGAYGQKKMRFSINNQMCARAHSRAVTHSKFAFANFYVRPFIFIANVNDAKVNEKKGLTFVLSFIFVK